MTTTPVSSRYPFAGVPRDFNNINWVSLSLLHIGRTSLGPSDPPGAHAHAHCPCDYFRVDHRSHHLDRRRSRRHRHLGMHPHAPPAVRTNLRPPQATLHPPPPPHDNDGDRARGPARRRPRRRPAATTTFGPPAPAGLLDQEDRLHRLHPPAHERRLVVRAVDRLVEVDGDDGRPDRAAGHRHHHHRLEHTGRDASSHAAARPCRYHTAGRYVCRTAAAHADRRPNVRAEGGMPIIRKRRWS